MIKKEYIQPEMSIVRLNTRQYIMTTSTLDYSSESTHDGTFDSRSFDSDFEEE